MSALDCNFGKAKVGDLIYLQSPFKFVPEVLGKLAKVAKTDKGNYIHQYDCFMLGIWFGRIEAKQVQAPHGVEWRVI